jgi:hypothetical protein
VGTGGSTPGTGDPTEPIEPNVPDNPTGDGGVIGGDAGVFPQDAGPFLDAFDFPMDAPEPSNPGGDQIP